MFTASLMDAMFVRLWRGSVTHLPTGEGRGVEGGKHDHICYSYPILRISDVRHFFPKHPQDILQLGLGDTVSFPPYIVFLPASDPPIVTKYISTRAAPSQRPNHPLGRTPRVIEARFS